jgi:ABC-type branched-subunit amino acid transport system substrate-binding protein
MRHDPPRKGEQGMSRALARTLALLIALSLVIAACGGSDDDGNDGSSGNEGDEPAAEKIDYKAIGLWDDGPCDEAKPKLKLGLMVVYESAFISLKDQATALTAAAEAFNKRGGANGACIEVHTCDDGANAEQSLACVREIDDAGVVATVNDQGTAGQDDVSKAMQSAKIPRVATNVAPADWTDPNAYPLDASGTGVTLMQPQALIDQDIKKIGVIRVGLSEAAALVGFLEQLYADEGATFPLDLPVPEGTTDYTQFILKAQEEGVQGVTISLGEQEAVQVARAGQQLNSELPITTSLGTFPHATVKGLGAFADHMVFMSAFPPATVDLPVYKALRADLAASDDEALQPENLKTSPMRSWIGLYALLYMIRQAKMTDFTRDGITAMLKQAKDVPMLDMFGGENWTPDLNHPGAFKRAGMNHWQAWKWDAEATGPDVEGNFVESTEMSFDEVLCGSPLGAPC